MDTQLSAAGVSTDWVVKTGAAARLSGIPVETLRVWERRHAVSGEPLRRGAHRLYSRAQVERLALVKRLVDGGHAIGSLAPLSDAQLAQMMSDASGLRGAAPPRHPTTVTAIRVGLVGFGAANRPLMSSLRAAAVDIVFTAPTLEGVGHLPEETLDVLFVELSSLTAEQSARLVALQKALLPNETLLFYRHAPSALIRGLMRKGIEATRRPTSADGVEQVCASVLRRLMAAQENGHAPIGSNTCLSEDVLNRLLDVKSDLYCECPQQLAHLLLGVVAFERYSAECASRDGLDALIHIQLQRVAAESRSLLDQALRRLLAAEGIEV